MFENNLEGGEASEELPEQKMQIINATEIRKKSHFSITSLMVTCLLIRVPAHQMICFER